MVATVSMRAWSHLMHTRTLFSLFRGLYSGQIAACHKLQHPFILDLLKRLIEGSYPMLEVHVQMELKRHLVEHLVQLLSCGHVLEARDRV